MRIYVAGQLSNIAAQPDERTSSMVVVDYIKNVHVMCKVARILQKRGHAPYIPALDLLYGLVLGNIHEEDYRGMGIEFLKVCDAMFIINWSSGVKREVEVAKEIGLPIYNTIAEVPDGRA